MDVELRTPRGRLLDVGMLKGGVVVDDQVQAQLRRGLRVNDLEKRDALLMGVTRHTLADQPVFVHFQGREQGGVPCRL